MKGVESDYNMDRWITCDYVRLWIKYSTGWMYVKFKEYYVVALKHSVW
jgi:hypothetical protein